MIKHLVALLVILQLLAGSAFAGKTVFVDGNKATRTPGTVVTAGYLNSVNNHRHDGKNVDGSGVLDYAIDTGSANAISITLVPAITAHIEGMPIWLKAAANNTGATTISVNGLAPTPLYKLGNQALAIGDIKAGQVIGVTWSGSAYQLTNYQSQPVTDATTLNGQSAAQLAPPGAVVDFAMPSVPSGWLLCDGRAVLRSAYPALYAAIGTAWGAGDNVSTFNLPDFRGEFRRGWDNGRGVDAGRTFGSFQSAQANRLIQMRMGTDNASAAPVDVPENGDWSNYIQTGLGGTTVYTLSVRNSGGETRSRNFAVLPCIKY